MAKFTAEQRARLHGLLDGCLDVTEQRAAVQIRQASDYLDDIDRLGYVHVQGRLGGGIDVSASVLAHEFLGLANRVFHVALTNQQDGDGS